MGGLMKTGGLVSMMGAGGLAQSAASMLRSRGGGEGPGGALELLRSRGFGRPVAAPRPRPETVSASALTPERRGKSLLGRQEGGGLGGGTRGPRPVVGNAPARPDRGALRGGADRAFQAGPDGSGRSSRPGVRAAGAMKGKGK